MKYLYIVLIAILLVSCKKDEIMRYSGDNGITFYLNANEVDSTSFSFSFAATPKQRDTVFFKMRVTGAASDVARTINVVPAAGTTARKGVDYDLPDFILPAGKLTALYPVVVYSTPEMLTQTFRIVARVGENADFKLGALGTELGKTVNVAQVKLDVTNRLVKPSYWTAVQSAFGTFSATKFRFMIQVTGLSDFSQASIGIDGFYNLPVKLRAALAEYEAKNGPLLDENGLRVTF